MSAAATSELFEPAAAGDLGLDPKRIDRAREMIHEQVDSGRSPGIVAFVARHGRCVLHEAAGVRSAAGDPMRTDSLFMIASATKPYTAALVMSLVEEGRIGLMQEVRDYLPELPAEATDGVLLHHLLTHTGGFDAPEWDGRLRTRFLERADEDAKFGRGRLVNAFLGIATGLKRIKPPGYGMLYASLNYELLGEIVRRVTGATLREGLEERIFAPLGITDTAMRPGSALRERLVIPGDDHPMHKLAVARFGHGFEDMIDADSAGAGLVSTPRAHATFEEMIRAGGSLDGVRVLSKASVRAMTHNQIPGVPDLVFGRKEASWGYGFSVICQERWPYYGGGLVPPGSVTHAGAGGIDHWIDFDNGIVAAYYEQVTEVSEKLEPISSAGHRFQDVITSAVLD